jgi:uncharacterized sulfatase
MKNTLPTGNKKLPNIVLIVLDTHRYDRISTYGYHRQTTPNLDDFGRQATVFENGISPAQWTIPAHASMFTGEYPTTHQTIQAHYRLDSRFDVLATLLAAQGYKTIGFCNNPLVGVLNNGLKRGFDTFYTYSGAFPSMPKSSNQLPVPLNQIWEWYTQQLRKWSYPVQNAFAHSELLFKISMSPLLVPLWARYANFKGDTAKSLRNTQEFLQHTRKDKKSKPNFVFVNLMEPHLPYTPPDPFVDRFAPYFKEDRQVRDFMRKYNYQAFRWFLPIEDRFKEMEARVLNDFYDAEVNYQDHLLAELLEYLSRDEVADNTLTIIVGDHGEGLGEHDFIGHAFVAYEELLHVPLMVKFPRQLGLGKRVDTTVSTRRVFHTVLDAVGVQLFETEHHPASDVKPLSLARALQGADPEQEVVFGECYAPNTFLSMMETHVPQLIETFHCKLNRRAVYQGRHKLARIDGVQDELFNLADDPAELDNLLERQPERATKLASKLDAFMVKALARRPDNWEANQIINLEEDENLRNQLRALGYID